MHRRWTVALLAGLAAVGSLGWWLLGHRRGETLERIEQEHVIRIGYAVEAPYAFLNAAGELTGTEVEVAKSVVARLGIGRIEWLQTEFGSLIPELEARRFDAVVAGMFITPDRARLVSFSEPTFRVRQALLVRAGNPLGLRSYEDAARRPQVKLAVLHGSIEERTLRALGLAESRIVIVPDALTGRVAVESGLASGLALSSPTVRYMAMQHLLGLTEVAEPFAAPPGRQTGYGAVVFRKADVDLLRVWNEQLRTFIGSTEHRRLLGEFGLTADELPAGATTAEILSAGPP